MCVYKIFIKAKKSLSFSLKIIPVCIVSFSFHEAISLQLSFLYNNFNYTKMLLKITIGDDKPMFASDVIYFHLDVFFFYTLAKVRKSNFLSIA